MNGIRIGLDDRSQNVTLAVQVAGFEVAQQRKVEQTDAPVGAQQAVLGIWIAGSDPRTPDETEEEAQHDLADAVALGLIEPRDLVEAHAIDVLRDEHATRRQIRVHAWHANVRVTAEQTRESALVLGFDLVVELIGDPLAHLAQQRSRVRTRRQALEDRAHESDVAQVGRDRVADVRLLHLHRDVLAVARPRAVNLTERRQWQMASPRTR